MDRQGFEKVCESLSLGEALFVRNCDSLYAGKVVGCRDDGFVVEVFGHKVEWPADKCDPVNRGVNPLGPPSNI